MNHVTLFGRLTADPELKQTPNGTAVTTFTLAVDRPFSKGEEKTADFFPVVCWRQTAEFAVRNLGKGQRAIVSGRLETRKWQDKQGQNRITTEVICETLEPVDWKERAAGTAKQNKAQATEQGAEQLPNDDDLPF